MHNDWNEYYYGVLKHLRKPNPDETTEHELGRLLEYVCRESIEVFPNEELRISVDLVNPDFLVKNGLVFMFYDDRFDPDLDTLRRFLKMKALQRKDKSELPDTDISERSYRSDGNQRYIDILNDRKGFFGGETQERALHDFLHYIQMDKNNTTTLGEDNRTDFVSKYGRVYMSYDPRYDQSRNTLRRFLKMKKMQDAVMGTEH